HSSAILASLAPVTFAEEEASIMLSITISLTRRLLITALIAGLFGSAATLTAGENQADSAPDKSSAADAKISLVIDYGDGVRKQIELPWQREMTVAQALE